MPKGIEDTELEDESSSERETREGNAGVSDRSERQIEAGADGADESKVGEDDSRDADEALDALAEADPKRAVVGLRKRMAKLTAQRNAARAEAEGRNADRARLAAYEAKERDAEKAKKDAERNTPQGQEAEKRRAAVRDTIDETYGPGTSDYLERRRGEESERDEQAREEFAMQCASHLRSELEDHGIKTDKATLIRWERAVGSELAEDAELLAAVRRPTSRKEAIAEAVDRVRNGLVNPILTDRGAKPLERIQRNREAVLGGGSSRGTMAETDEPAFDLTPPKGLHGRDLENWWDAARDKYREQLLSASD